MVLIMIFSCPFAAAYADNSVMLSGNYTPAEFAKIIGQNSSGTTFVSDGTAVVRGDYAVEGWSETTLNGITVFSAPANGSRISALFKESRKLHAASIPYEGYLTVTEECYDDAEWTTENTAWSETVGQHSFMVDKEAVKALAGRTDYSDITVRVIHKWHDEVSPMKAFNAENGRITMKKASTMFIKNGNRVRLENVVEALGNPGDWCYDSTNDRILYVPESGETTANIRLTASCSAELLTLANAENLTFKNIVFENSGWDYAGTDAPKVAPQNMFPDDVDIDLPQAAVDVNAAVDVSDGKNIVFQNCEFKNIGVHALSVNGKCENVRVDSCLFRNIGASAVICGGINADGKCPKNTVITNCDISEYGENFNSACGILYTFCDSGEISNNEIHDGFYTGISCGWVWLYGEHITNNIKIRDNLIYNIGKGLMSDLGGIYLLGRQRGSEVCGNVIHDIVCDTSADGYAGSGIYTDAGSSRMEIYNNLIFDCSSYAFNATLGTCSKWYNNIAAFSGQSCVNIPQSALGFYSGGTYYNNIILTDSHVPAFMSFGQSSYFNEYDNLIWDLTNGKDVYFKDTYSLSGNAVTRESANRNGYFNGSVFANPEFKDAPNRDFTLSDSSPAFKLGFKEWDYSEAGTLPDTVIGLSLSGGKTPYNGGTNTVTVQQHELSSETKLKDWFFNMIEKIKALFGLNIEFSENTASAGKPSDFVSDGANQNTDELTSLFDEVKKFNPSFETVQSKKPYADRDDIEAIYFTDMNSNKVFAYIGFPKNAAPNKKVPAMVLVHGGNGHAFAEWVKYWVDNGYAAIAIDGFGQHPADGYYKDKFSNDGWSVNPESHIPYDEFSSAGKPYDEQWFTYFISDIILANNIMRADGRVNKDQIGITGISWGGYATSVVIGYDNRFEFAVPVYGCGFLDKGSALFSGKNMINRDGIKDSWEASMLFDRVDMPVLFINGDSDIFFSADATTASAAACKNGECMIIPNLAHGHAVDFDGRILNYANAQNGLNGNILTVSKVQLANGEITVSFAPAQTADGITARLYYRTEPLEYQENSPFELKSKWKSVKCKTDGNLAKAKIPSEAKYIYVYAENKSGLFGNKLIASASTGVYKLK